MIEIGYKPSRWGEVFHALPHDEALGAGSAGPGKTTILLHEPHAQIIVEHQRCQDRRHPFHNGWGDSRGWALLLRRTLKELEQSMGETHREFPKMDPGAHWDTQKTTWTFSSGYKYQFAHCKDRDSWADFMSNAYTIICFDELVTFEEEQYRQIITRLRTDDPVLSQMMKIRAMSNPLMRGGVSVQNPNWVREYFVDPAPAGKETLVREVLLDSGKVHRATRIYMPATLYDNPNKAFVLQYEARLASAPKHIREALLYGNWYFTAGAFFGDVWNKAIHVCKTFNTPPDWPVFRSMDWGYKQPGCVGWFAMDDDGNLFMIRELTFRGKDVEEVAALIREIEKDMKLWADGKSRISGPADYQLWEDRGDVGLSKAAIMAKNGVLWHRADKKSRVTNAERLLFRLKGTESGSLKPGLVFFDTCHNTIRTVPMIQTDPDRPDLPADGGEDHWLDMVQYACAFASYGRAGIGSVRRKRDPWEDDDDAAPASRTDRGRSGYGEGY